MSFLVQKDNSGRIIKKTLTLGTSQTVTTNPSLASSYSIFSTNATSLTLNNVTVTASAEELNQTSNITPGTSTSNKPLVLDSSKNISNINTISCSNIIINGTQLGGNSGQSNQILNNITPGTVANSKAVVLDNSRNITNLNNVSTNILSISNANLNIEKDYEGFCNTFTSTSINNSNNWVSSCWADTLNLFVAISNTGTGNRVMTSPDGITWTIQTSPADYNWTSICWSKQLTLLVSVSSSGIGNRVMTSSDGINWTLRTTPVDNNWSSVCWASELNLFVAVSNSENNDKVMTSPNGINWTLRSLPKLNITNNISSSVNHNLVVLSDGTIRAWGRNNAGQLGDNTTTQRNTQVQVSGITNAIAISAGSLHSLALLADGTIRVWGSGNVYGQLGNGTFTGSSNIPIQVSGITNAIAISAGEHHSLALLSDGTIRSWGYNVYGQLGDGTITNKNTPIQVLEITNAIAISAGHIHSLALLSDGTIRAWGANNGGQLGNGTTTFSKSIQTQVFGITNAIAISAGTAHSLALLADGTIRVWGSNGSGRLGNGTFTGSSNIPIQVSGITNAIAISISFDHSLVLLSDGTIRAWGGNGFSQLGDGTITSRSTPIQVPGITNAIAISAGEYYSLVLLADGTLLSWGNNEYGQLGDGTITNRNIPVSVLTSLIDSTPLSNILLTYNLNYNSITWSRNLNLLVAVGNSNKLNKVITSSDGINWNYQNASSNSNWQSVCWAAEIGMYIAIANNGTTRIMTSTDGIFWIPRTSNITNDWTHIVWSNEFKIAMAICNNYSNSKILISSDGINWMPSNTNNRKKLTSICWSNTLKKFCLLSNNDDSYRYLDNWVVSAAPINITNEFRHVTWISQLNLFIGVGGSGSIILTSPDGITWTSRTSPNAGLFNNCVVYSPILNLLVLVGDGRFSNPYIFTSPDGITWTSRTGPAAVNWTNVTWGNGLFIATAQNTGNASTSIMTSANGINWTLRTAPASAEWWETIWVEELSLFICVGSGSSSSGRIMTSPDGITWTSRISPEENNWKGVAWSPSLQLLVAIADNPASNINPIMTSSDGINWISYPAPITYLWSILWSSELNMFVAINKDSRSNTTSSYMYSSNGTEWVTGLTNINQQFWSITWSGLLNTFIAVSSLQNNENIIRSIPSLTDSNIYSFLTTYSNATLNLSKIIKNIYPNKSVIKYGLKQWYPISSATENNWNSIIWAKNNFIITGENDSNIFKVLYSNNGITWNTSNISQYFRGNSLAYSPELDIVICVGNTSNLSFAGNICSSINDGVSWVFRLYNNNNWKSICWSQDLMMFVTVGDSGNFNRVAISYDGSNWFLQETNNNNWNSVCWSSELQLFVAVSSTGTNRVMTSPNGINWTTYSAASNLNWTSVCWSPELQLFVAVASSGLGNRIMTSSNGINWTSRISPEDNNWNCVIWVSELRVFTAVASSGLNRLMYSFNGIDWKGMYLEVNNSWGSICWSPNYGQFIMVSNDGTGNKIYRSRIITLTQSNSLLSGSPNVITNNLLSNNGLLSFNLGSNPTTYQLEYHNNGITFAVPYSPFYYNMNLRSDFVGFDMNTTNFSINIADHNGTTSGLALNGTLITTSADNINRLSNITFGLAKPSKLLTLDSNKSIININNLSCNLLTITSLFSNFEEGISSSNNLLITNSNKEINNINSLESKIVKIKNSSLTGYDNQLISNIQYATTFTRCPSIANISSLINGIWVSELNIFVAITGVTSNNYRTAISPDGYNWAAYNHSNIANNEYPLTSIAWSPKLELFVITSNSTGRSSANFYTTKNAISLNPVTVPYLGNWVSVTWSPQLEMFAAICRSANFGTSVITSTDGITWITRTAVDDSWNDIRVLNGNFIAMTFTSYLLSTDGITWTKFILPTSNSMSWNRMTYSPTLDLYVIVGSTGTISRIITSSDLTNWTNRTTPVLNAWSNVLWLNDLNIFLGISSSASSGTDNKIIFSSDGINWFIKSNTNYNYNFSNIMWSPSLSRIVLLYSSNTVLISNSSLLSKLTEYKNNQYKLTLNKLIEKNTKSIGTKINLVNNWNSITSAINNNWTSICRSESLNLFAAVSSSGTNNRVMTSTNGNSWTSRTTPTIISMAPTVHVKYISAGFGHSLALMSDGTVKSWGDNEYGQLGDGTTISSNTPITISGLTNVIGISAGVWSSYALLSDGTIKSWGYNVHGELGDGTDIDKLTPVSVIGISTAINISNGDSHAIALLNDGTVKSWGTNYEGELGDGTNNGSLSPVTVSNLSNVIAIDANGSHNLALLSDGTVKAWGYNESGQLGNNSTISSSTVVTVSNLSGVKKIACGSTHSLALLNDGTIKGWGSNGWGQLGDETYDDKLTPVTTSGLSNVKNISGGYNFSLALLDDGTIKSWGDNSYGKLGVNSDDTTLVKTNSSLTVNTITTSNSISAGTNHTLLILENGNIMSWGRNNTGQLGNNSTTDTISPINVHTSSINSDPLTSAKIIQYTISSNNSNDFTSICWSPDLSLFVAVASSGTGDRVMTSSDGITWTSQTSVVDNNWTSVIWCKELILFVAVSSSGTNNRVMTSPDGITWTSRTSASDNNWSSVCWAPELSLLVAVSTTGTGDRVMTSSDGITWTSRTSASDNNWTSVCWCNNINIFIAVSNSNDSYRRVMTSEDGINWILRYSGNNNNWKQVIWINELNMAVAISDSGDKRIMTSFNGIDWQLRNLSITNSWTSIAWASDLGILCAISNTNTENQIATTIMTYPTYKTGLIAYPGQLTINNSNRRIGLGILSPSYQLHLSSDSAYKLSTSTWTVSSDIRLKKNIQDADLDECYNKIKSLPLKRYKWKDDIYTNEQVHDRTKLGWIADDVQLIFPNSVKEIEANGLTDCKSMDIDQIIASLYGCIKKLMLISENKKNTIIELQNKINNYKNIINSLEIVEE
jgi:alpha-tubulin suppressor-like RCC1 family protein